MSPWAATITLLVLLLIIVLDVVYLARAILRRHRVPSSRFGWVVIIYNAPLIGIIAYLLFGDTNIGRKRVEKQKRVQDLLPPPETVGEPTSVEPSRFESIFAAGASINGFRPVGGNGIRLFSNSAETIGAIVADIDAATSSVHLLFYIWLADKNGGAVAEAVCRAARRGVTCRILADSLGSRGFIHSAYWKRMRDAGARVETALPLGGLSSPFRGRVDMRNHRKIVVIDDHLSYCGSQNCADAAFAPKLKFGPWVDIMLRIEGPVSLQNQYLFASDWMLHVDEDLSETLSVPVPDRAGEVVAQAVGTGAGVRYSSMPELFVTLMFAARKELVVTTPYYVPDEALHAALCASAHRGVDTKLVLPRRNDSWVVSAASRSYYLDLLEAGVTLYEHEPGLLHAKTLTIDGEVALVGSANLDRRSFELNFENNLILFDRLLAMEIRSTQDAFIAQSAVVKIDTVRSWPAWRRLWQNAVAMVGPIL